ncbi:hypothetical protein FDP41_012887 [Naegleria fowleri]|uniref:Uncharacterized protein n=1 Tax=Naegleria fowleri TaxID=5763 RepID=A0A6A5C727_NAEFO|nr:uncharacterized protein FDP41_012887 [Naegleria fowleri]KAF0981099.1 hypothetical protein FDP41_012887 [Naegleria fowleri]CAG4711724.1 unnamed protein product [Naegleria fowleri]
MGNQQASSSSKSPLSRQHYSPFDHSSNNALSDHQLLIPSSSVASKHRSGSVLLDSNYIHHHHSQQHNHDTNHHSNRKSHHFHTKLETEFMSEHANSAFSNSQLPNVISSLTQYKILLLGSGSSGKSTFFKAIELFKKGSFSNTKKGVIYFNIIKDIGELCKDYLRTLTQFLNYERQNSIENLEELKEIFPNDLPRSVTDAMERLVKLAFDKSFIQSAVKRSSDKSYNQTYDTHFGEQVYDDIELLWKFRPFHLFAHYHISHIAMPSFSPSCENEWTCTVADMRNYDYDDLLYFLDHRMKDIYPPYQYEPNSMDVLHRRQKTVGLYYMHYIEDAIFENGIKETRDYLFVDTGGQRSEQKKWSLVMPNSFVVFYFVALSDINVTLYEDVQQNRFFSSLLLFEKVCKEVDLANVPFILFFTKADIYKKKIKRGLNPIELFESMNRSYQMKIESSNSSVSQQDETETEVALHLQTSEPALRLDLSSEQVEKIYQESIEYFTCQFKKRLYGSGQTLEVYALNSTDPNEFTSTFKKVMGDLNKIKREP